MFDFPALFPTAITPAPEETPAPPPASPAPAPAVIDLFGGAPFGLASAPPVRGPVVGTGPAPTTPPIGPPAPPPHAVELVDPERATQNLQIFNRIAGTTAPQTTAPALDDAVPESQRGRVVAAQANIQDPATYWSENEHYVDPDSGIVYAASYDEAAASLTLERRQQIEDDEWANSTIVVADDGASSTETESLRLLDDGGFEVTSWASQTNADGSPRSLRQEVSTTQNLEETGVTQIRTSTTFDVDAPPIDTPDGPMPPVDVQRVTVDMERGPLSTPPGPATQTTATTFSDDGLPTRQTTALTQSSTDFDSGDVQRFEGGVNRDLRTAENDDYDPNASALTDPLPAADSSQVRVQEVIAFNEDGEPVSRTQTQNRTAVESVPDEDGAGVRVVHHTASTQWGDVVDPRATDRIANMPPLTESTIGAVTVDQRITMFDPTGSGFRADYPIRQSVAMHSEGTVDPDGAQRLTAHDPAEIRVLQEGADDDWIYDSFTYTRAADGSIPEDPDETKIAHEQDLDFWEEGIPGWVKNNLGVIGAGLTATGLVLQIIPIVGNAVGAGFIAAGFGVAAIDTALQTHAAINDHPGASWTNVGFSAIGLVPGGRFAAVRAATGLRATTIAGVRASFFAADAAVTTYAAGDVVHGVATGEGVSLEDMFFAASLAAGHLANNRIGRRQPVRDFETTPLEATLVGEHNGTMPGRPDLYVNYLGRNERGVHELYVQDGLLYGRDGRRFDSTDARSFFGADQAIFVLSPDGRIYASTQHEFNQFHHSSFLSGQPVAAAGEIRVIDGELTLVQDRSGHYHPDAEYTLQFLRYLDELGVDLGSVRMQGYNVEPGIAADLIN